MRKFYAVYDNKDNFIDCGYTPKELGENCSIHWARLHRNKGTKKGLMVYEIPLTPQNDVFKEEDEIFLQEEGDNVFFDREIAEKQGITLRTLYRRRKKQNERN